MRKIVGKEIDEVKNQKPTIFKEPGKTVAFKIESEEDFMMKQMLQTNPNEQSQQTLNTSKSGGVGAGGKGLKWYEKVQDFDITIHANFIAFSIQCLMGVKKWESLVDLSNRMNTVTDNTYAQYLLPFIIYAQTTLFEDASAATKEKRSALNIRIQQFENWKLTNKKKRSRQALITGEIPPEEQEFLKDKAQFEKEIFRLEIIENILLNDKQQSDILLENIKRDANNCEETLKLCRKQYLQFGVDTQYLKILELKKGAGHYEVKKKKQGLKVFSSMIINNYKSKCIEMLRKRQEKFMLIQALHELGNILYADGQLGEAEIQWNDCVDTIFQRLYVVNSWRQVYKDNPQLADSFGSSQCLIGGIVLTKLAKLCYEGRDQFRYNECILMAADLFAAPAKLSFPHPQIPIEYHSYRLREFLGESLFSDKQILTPSELLHTLHVAGQALMDSDLPDKALPLFSLMEYLASEITKSKVLTLKARILKGIALIEIGYINEAYQIFNRILQLKDLPKIGNKESEFLSKKEGKNFNFPFNSRYYNQFPPEHEKNQEAIQFLLKPLAIEQIAQIKKFSSPYVYELFQYMKGLFLLRLGESENVEAPEKADLRNSLLKGAEEQFRMSLKNLAVFEEVSYIKDKLDQLSQKEIDIPETEINDTKIRLQRCYEANVVSEEEQKVYFSNKEEEMCYADRRSQILSQIMRVRMAVARSYQKQGILLQSFYILRQSLLNFKNFAEGKHSKFAETGFENEDKGSLKVPDMYSVGMLQGQLGQAQPAAGGKDQGKKPVPAQDKKPAGGKGPSQQQLQQEEELQKKQEEERKKREAEEEQKEKEKIESAEKRDHPHIYLWLKTKLELINILFMQKRFEDCGDCIAIAKLECLSVNDMYFSRMLQEIQFMMEVYRGEIESALKMAEEIRKLAQTYNHSDVSYATFLGNLSELMYNKDKRKETSEVIKEGRLIIWYKLRDYGLDLDPQNINFKGDVKVNKQRPKLNEDVLAQYQSQAVPQGKGAPNQAKQAPPKGGAQAKGQAQQVIEDLPVEEEKVEAPLDFSKKIEYQLDQADPIINSSLQEQTVYLKYLELAMRFDIRYSQYLTLLENKHDLARKVLTDTEKLLRRTLHVSPQLKFYLYYFLGYTNLQIFYEKMLEFQDKYSSNQKYVKNQFTVHIPYGSIALGKHMIELPNFNDKLKKFYKDYLEWSKKGFKQAVDVGKQECVINEFDFTIVDALRGLAEASILISEYRVRTLSYKYAKYKELDQGRKLQRIMEQKKEANQSLDDNLLEEMASKQLQEQAGAKDEWEEQKINKEKLEIANCRRQAIHYLEWAVTISKAQREIQDKQQIVSAVNLTDQNKIPKEIAYELYECYFVAKVNYVKVPDFDPKDKAAITSSELISYLKALVKELEFMTFGDEKTRMSKLISKLHRYLKLNLASYVQKCVLDIKEPDEIKDPNLADTIELIPKSKILAKWFDFKLKKSSLFYIIGPIDDQLLNTLYPNKEPNADEQESEAEIQKRNMIRKDQTIIHF